jgi:hypothetical protein
VALGEGDFYEIALEVFVGKDVAGDGGGAMRDSRSSMTGREECFFMAGFQSWLLAEEAGIFLIKFKRKGKGREPRYDRHGMREKNRKVKCVIAQEKRN